MRHDSRKTTHILLGLVVLLLGLNLADRWFIPHSQERDGESTSIMDRLVTPAQAQVMSQIGRVYTTSEDGRTLVEWRRNNQIWSGRAFTAEDADERW
ncbi:MAG: hypothetical protein JJU11_08130 [Candidatus Sumerlaeia bacterium]|nr:hypothetical protein [Candidatus Sumerlaeia bacterium]